MWMPVPRPLAFEAAGLLAWYVIAFTLLLRLRRTETVSTVTASPQAWRSLACAIILAGTAGWIVRVFQEGTVFPAYAVALLTAFLCFLLIGRYDPACSDQSVLGATPLWLLALAALLLRMAAPAAGPVGLAADEAKKCLDCIADLGGILSAFRVGTVAHTDFPCLVLGPLLAIFGPGVFVAHVYAMIAGALSVVAFYVLASLLLTPTASLAAAALLVASPYHLLYSEVLFGTEITLPQVLFLAFAIDAARRLRWSSALLAGSALGIVLYHYVVVRAAPAALVPIFVFAQFADRRRYGRRTAILGLILLTTLATIAPMLARPDGRGYLFNPIQFGLFVFGTPMSASDAWHRMVNLVRDHLLMFRLGVGGAHGVIAHSRAAMLPWLLELLMILGFADSVVRLNRFAQPVMASLFAIGLLPSILSGAANSHRSMLVIPAVYLLIGNALDRLSFLVPRRRCGRLAVLLLFTVVVVVGACQSVLFYFGPAWNTPNDAGEFGGMTAELAREVTSLTTMGQTFTTAVPEAVTFLNYDQIRKGLVQRFAYADWLPENWAGQFRGLIFDGNWADLRWQLEEALPGNSLRVLVDRLGRPIGVSVRLAPDELRISKPPNPERPQCGALMLAAPKRVTNVREGDLEIDGISVRQLPADQQPWFAAGLHRACLAGGAAVELVDRVGTRQPVRLNPADLYRVPVHGWLHRVECSDSPGRVSYLGVEPFLFHHFDGVSAQPLCTGAAHHIWSAVLAPQDTDTAFQLWSDHEGVEISLGGPPVAPERRGAWVRFDVPASSSAHIVELRAVGSGRGSEALRLILYTLQGSALRVPRYDWFSPPQGETFRSPSAFASENASG
ncbi:MAG: hypothetical protein H6Q33_4456 [Deltaproteobacteria bacterium]|nr:hypothetical protein [Deltaproteobacteria bacterium]